MGRFLRIWFGGVCLLVLAGWVSPSAYAQQQLNLIAVATAAPVGTPVPGAVSTSDFVLTVEAPAQFTQLNVYAAPASCRQNYPQLSGMKDYSLEWIPNSGKTAKCDDSSPIYYCDQPYLLSTVQGRDANGRFTFTVPGRAANLQLYARGSPETPLYPTCDILTLAANERFQATVRPPQGPAPSGLGIHNAPPWRTGSVSNPPGIYHSLSILNIALGFGRPVIAFSSPVNGFHFLFRKEKGDSQWTFVKRTGSLQDTFFQDVATRGKAYDYMISDRSTPWTYSLEHPTELPAVTAYSSFSFTDNIPTRYNAYTGQQLPSEELLNVSVKRGTALLVVENGLYGETSDGSSLIPYIEQFRSDLALDGWDSQVLNVSKSDRPADVKSRIKAQYDASGRAITTLILLGHVPVPYSGQIAFDGHPENQKPWPSDGYYADMDGVYTDTATGLENTPGDGKFDQDFYSGGTILQIGRIDMSSLPAFLPATELDLLKRYFKKNHAYRVGDVSVGFKALIGAYAYNHIGFADSAWGSFSSVVWPYNIVLKSDPGICYRGKKPGLDMVDRDRIDFEDDLTAIRDQWCKTVDAQNQAKERYPNEACLRSNPPCTGEFLCAIHTPACDRYIQTPFLDALHAGAEPGKSYLLAFGTGGGSPTSSASIATTDLFANREPYRPYPKLKRQAIIMGLFGSHFGKWDQTDDLLRAAIASPYDEPVSEGDTTLAALWGRDFYLNRLAIGDSLGEAVQESDKNRLLYVTRSSPGFAHSNGSVRRTIIGDPTVRITSNQGPKDVITYESGGNLEISWLVNNPLSIRGYAVSYCESRFGPCRKVATALPKEDHVVLRAADFPGRNFMVQTIGTSRRNGQWINVSRGSFGFFVKGAT